MRLFDDGVNNGAKRGTHHDSYGKVYDVALHNEILESCQHRTKLEQGSEPRRQTR